MITLAAFIVFLGFYLLYNTSKKAQLHQTHRLEIWAHHYPNQSKVIGLLLFLVGLLIAVFDSGLGAGIFTFFVLLMTIGSLVVVVTPIRFLNFKTLIVLFAISFIFELL
ncbi:hypothetical protein DN752_23220 [Echinicola strongylocentroti]|uniref:DUF3325 domain-containing protein n=1 Tax=Echinicola strongylocentroti TaxID=1795355 RepID=A0A2Z4IPR6_9BACT|nr:hypothetical protein [Echinicola strongylocentroti]AWW32817.1 hypothetical protein DN752_23220 [Echinicola strongylocentroti]